jgi:hypothetical protein
MRQLEGRWVLNAGSKLFQSFLVFNVVNRLAEEDGTIGAFAQRLLEMVPLFHIIVLNDEARERLEPEIAVLDIICNKNDR